MTLPDGFKTGKAVIYGEPSKSSTQELEKEINNILLVSLFHCKTWFVLSFGFGSLGFWVLKPNTR